MEKDAEAAKNGGVYGEARVSSSDVDVLPYARGGFLATLRQWENMLDKKLGVESHGPERMRPEERDPAYARWHNQAVMFLLWLSSTLNLGSFATGFLGRELGLDLRRTIVIIVFGTLLGAMVPGWCATMGPGTGLRQVSISRYSLGWWPAKVVALVNAVEQVGWAALGCITGGIALSTVSGGQLGTVPGIIIAALLSFVISFVGLKAVFQYNKFAGLTLVVVFIVMYGEVSSSADMDTQTVLSGSALSASALSLFAIMYGSTASWCSIVSDYYVEYPVDTSKLKIFLLTTLGIWFPATFGMVVGALSASALDHREEWAAAYEMGLGSLVQVMIYPTNLAKTLLVLLALATVAVNAVGIYSAGLSLQQFARPLEVVPRFVWTTLMFGAMILLSLAGRDQLLSFLQSFLSLLGYWNTSFFVIMAAEHYAFRDGYRSGFANYDLEAWDTPSRMPVGLAGGVAFAAGIGGGALGMNETWYVGKLAAMIGVPGHGGDIGNQLALAFSLLVFLPARWLEYRVMNR